MRNIKSVFRSFLRKPTTSVINVVGLSLSLSLVIILSAFCYNELTTDNHHENGNNSYLFSLNINGAKGTSTHGILKDEILQKVAGVKNAVRTTRLDNPPVFEVAENQFKPNLVLADKGFFEIFSYKIKEGNLKTALDAPNGVVLTEEFSEKLYGNQSAVGEVIEIEDNLFTVKAVIRKSAHKSFLNFDALTNFQSLKTLQPYTNSENWSEYGFLTFVKLSSSSNPTTVANSIFSIHPEHMLKSIKVNNIQCIPQLTSIKDIYYSGLNFSSADYINLGEKQKTLTLLMVVVLILIIAIFSFINISVFQWHDQLKQTGTMKVLGADRFSIIKNLLSESLLIFLVSFILSLLIVVIISPTIQKITGLYFRQDLIFSFRFLSLAIILSAILSILISIIPIVRIAKSAAYNNLQKSLFAQKRKGFLQGAFVSSQFAIAIVLIAFTMLVQKQIYFGSSNFGFNKDLTIAIPYNKEMWDKNDVIKAYLEKTPHIQGYSFTQFYPGKPLSGGGTMANVGGENKVLTYNRFCADKSFFGIMNLNFINGESFSDNKEVDKYKVVVNETFINKYGIENPIGFKFPMDKGTFEIVGVVEDFHYDLVYRKIEPLVIRNLGYTSVCIINLASNDFNILHTTIKDINKFVAQLTPNFPVEVKFLDQAIADMYKSEVQFRRIFTLFAFAAIIICMLGIFAMSLFACQKRTKEIGIRKVNGATIFEVIQMLNYKFMTQVFFAIIIACPIAYYAMDKWLESFAYKTAISWWIFVIAGLSALIVAITTVTMQSLKAANRNPIDALRYE